MGGWRGGGGTEGLNEKNRPWVVFKKLVPPCFENNWIVIRIASRLLKRAQDLNFSCFWVLKYVGNFIGSNPFEPEPDQNRGPVQSSGIHLNQTVGPVHSSQKTLENQTELNFGITRHNNNKQGSRIIRKH